MTNLHSLLHPRLHGLLVVLALSGFGAAPAFADDDDKKDADEESFPELPEDSTTLHQVTINGQVIEYEATAGTITLADEDGDERGHVFYIAYSKRGETDAAKRSVTFTFNGGPGSSSVWLHLGLVGPRRVVMDDEGFPLPPPASLVDNEYSMLDVTDIVCIDPVMTGYSRPAEDEDRKQFHGFDEDVRSVGEFIRMWTTRNKRWASPKFLCGESYGTTRAAGLTGYLQGRHGMYLNGVVLVSAILNFQTARFEVGNDLPYPLFLPTYTATAYYHGQLAPDLSENLEQTLREVEAFALDEYAPALMKGVRLSPEERDSIATKLARYTGLTKEYVLSTDLRINIHRFTKELRRDEDLSVGRLDSRFTGRDRNSAGQSYDFDPSYAAIQGPYTAAVNHYLREELRYESEWTYEILTGRVHPWSYDNVENSYLNVAETLRKEMSRNRNLQVYVANGYYDLATPYFATHYTFDHLSMDREYLERVTMGHYECGHMMYIRLADLAALREDLVKFYAKSLGR